MIFSRWFAALLLNALVAAAFGATSLMSAYERYFQILVPLMLLWLFFFLLLLKCLKGSSCDKFEMH